jgi:hypothetical protein
MPAAAVVEAFVKTVEDGRYLEAIERYYSPDASMRENGAEPRTGLAALLANEKDVLARFASIRASRLGPVLIGGDHVAIPWAFDFAIAGGASLRLEEVAWQRWQGDKVAEERFFYDPRQLSPA